MADREAEHGPIDVVVIGYPPGAPMSGEAISIFLELVDRAIIRVLDALFVRRERDGTVTSSDLGQLDQESAGDLTAFAGATSGLLDDDDVALVAAEVAPGGAALMIVYENSWAAPFVAAVRRNGGVLISNQRIGVQELIDAREMAETTAE